MTVLNIRGTSGSGKSTLARNLMALYGPRMKVFIPGRKQPQGYLLQRPEGGRPLAVIGHYETACGGCDTIPDMGKIYFLVRQADNWDYDVLYEGLLISAEVNRAIALAKDVDLHVIALDLPIELCVDSVNQRRQAKTPGKAGVNPKNTISKHRGVQTSAKRLIEAGVKTHVIDDRAAAFALARGILKV